MSIQNFSEQTPNILSVITSSLAMAVIVCVINSVLEAIDLLAERYSNLGKKLRLRDLNPDCLILLDKARA